MELNQNNDKKKPTNGNGPKNSQIIIALVIVGVSDIVNHDRDGSVYYQQNDKTDFL